MNPSASIQSLSDVHALHALFVSAVKDNVSQIQIRKSDGSYQVYRRVLGQLEHFFDLDDGGYAKVVDLLKSVPEGSCSDDESTYSAQFPVLSEDDSINAHVSVLGFKNDADGIHVSIRIQNKNAKMKLKDLGISTSEEIMSVCQSPGIFVVCSRVDNGKTTTAHAIASEVGAEHLRKASDSFDGLETAPPVPLVTVLEEVRDSKDVSIAIKRAEMGDLVILTLSADSIEQAYERLLGFGFSYEKQAALLRGMLVQRLVIANCTICSGAGCSTCKGKGYDGRILVSESIVLRSPEDMEKVKIPSWTPMLEDAYRKYLDGRINRMQMQALFGYAFEKREKTLP